MSHESALAIHAWAQPVKPLSDLDDSELVGAAARGDREAFDVLVERHRRAVYQVCYRFVNNHEDASDLAQDAFVRAWRGLKNFRGQSALSTWLYRIAVNVCLNRVGAKTPPMEPIDSTDHVADLRIEGARTSAIELLERESKLMQKDIDRTLKEFQRELSEEEAQINKIEHAGQDAVVTVIACRKAMLSFKGE